VLPQSRLFETHVKVLELEVRMGSQPMVLIARLDDDRTLFAVEREDRGLYVLCQLGSWVNLQQLRAAAVATTEKLSNKALEKALSSNANSTTTAILTPEASKYSKKKRLAIEAIQSMVKRPSKGLSESQIATPGPDSQQEQPLADAPEDVTTQLSAAEMFENIRTHYLEALYLSKVFEIMYLLILI
jgi:DNA replication regulator SLD3